MTLPSVYSIREVITKMHGRTYGDFQFPSLLVVVDQHIADRLLEIRVRLRSFRAETSAEPVHLTFHSSYRKDGSSVPLIPVAAVFTTNSI